MAKKNGRPTKYKKAYDELAYNYTLLGATDVELAKFFDTSKQTVGAWKNNHPSFLASIKAGKEIADGMVARRLYERALGYEHEEEKIFQHNGEIVRTTTKKHYPPDTRAAQFWLMNRQRDKFTDKKEVEVTSNGPLVIVRDFTGIDEETDD